MLASLSRCAPNRAFALAALLACTVSAGFAARPISVDQLQGMVTSAEASGKTDAQIARSLAGIELTERITESARARLLAHVTGPRTRDVVEILADVSAFLDPPAESGAAAERPSRARQSEILSRAFDYTIGYYGNLPDYICTRVTRRFDDQSDLVRSRPEVWGALRLRDMFMGDLSFNHGTESYVDRSGDDRFAEGSWLEARGLTSFGEFSGMMAAPFAGVGSEQTAWNYTTWSYWDTWTADPSVSRLAERPRVAVFHYSVPAAQSRYRIAYCCVSAGAGSTVSVIAAYQGDIYIEPDSGAILRITRQAVRLPPGFPTHRSETLVDYRPVRIGAQSYRCPVRSVVVSESTGRRLPSMNVNTRYLNEIRFVRYHKFRTESRLLTVDSSGSAPPSAPDASPWDTADPWLELDAAEESARLGPEPQPEAPATLPRFRPVTIRTTTQVVEVPTVVHGRQGEPVTGLEKRDFEIYDNGKRQGAGLFVVEKSARAAPAPNSARATRRVFSNRDEQSSAPTNSTVILLDRMNTDWSDLAYASREIIRFLRELPPGEAVGLYVMDWGSFTILSDLTRDSASLATRLTDNLDRTDLTPVLTDSRRVDIELPKAGGPAGPAMPPIAAASCLPGQQPLRVLAGVAEHLAQAPGRKTLVWVSAGFPLVQLDGARSAVCEGDLVEAVRAINDANVAVYSVDAPGLQTALPDLPGAAIPPNQETMLELSRRTGGRAFLNANDIHGAVQTAFDDRRGSYRLGFYRQPANDGRYHELQVKLANRPEARLRFRRGYFDALRSQDPKTQLRDALLSPVNAVDIPVTAQLAPDAGSYELRLSLGLAEVTLEPGGGRWQGRLEVALVQRDENGGQLERLDQTLGLELKKDAYEAMLKSGFPYRHSFAPKKNAASLRVVVRDPVSGALGSLTIPLDRPPQ